MKTHLLTSLILSCHLFVSPTVLALEINNAYHTTSNLSNNSLQVASNQPEDIDLIARRGGGGNRVSRSGGNRASGSRNMNLNRDRSHSNRINRQSANRGGQRDRQAINQGGNRNINRDRARQGLQNVDRDRARQGLQNVDRDRARQGLQNVDRDRVQTRLQNNNINRDDVRNRLQNNNINRDDVRNRLQNTNVSLDNDRNFSNRIDRDNIGNRVRIGDNNIIVNPRGYGNWGWNGGVAWTPVNTYWGGGFWGPFAVGAVTGLVTGAAIDTIANNNNPDTVVVNNTTKYVIVQNGTPGYQLLTDYGLTQTSCSNDVVIIYGPSDSQICAIPNSNVPAGVYTIDATTLTLIPDY